MQLTRELLLAYPGLHGLDGLCHIRVYEQTDRPPVVIAGALDDNPGSSPTNAIALLAAAIQASQFPDGRSFRLIEHYPGTLDGRGIPTYALIHFERRPVHARPHEGSRHTGTVTTLGGETGRARDSRVEGSFRNPRWETIDDVEQLLECTVAVWPPGSYTAGAIAGEEGERLRSLLAENANQAEEHTER
jgi:hypothetical protein